MNDFRLYRLRMEAHGSASIAKKKAGDFATSCLTSV
jgi:hypothetical protein